MVSPYSQLLDRRSSQRHCEERSDEASPRLMSRRSFVMWEIASSLRSSQ
jgi:hypothetical protein